MAGIDHSIYFQQQPLDIMGNVTKGIEGAQRLSDLAAKKKLQAREQGLQDAYKSSAGPDGQIDKKMLLSNLAKGGYGQEAMELEGKITAQDANAYQFNQKKQLDELSMIGRAANGVKDQASYEQALGFLSKNGVDTTNMPRAYDPQLVQGYRDRALTAAERIDRDLRERQLESQALDRKEARDERRFQSGIRMDEKRQALTTPFGLANTEQDAKDLKGAFESKRSFDRKLNELIQLRKDYGVEYLNRDAVARGKQLAKDLLLEYKDMAKLGVLSQSDEKILNAIIPDDPLGQDFALGQDPILHKLTKFKEDSDADFQTKVGTRTRAGVGGIASEKQAPPADQGEAESQARQKRIAELKAKQKKQVAGGQR
jgi:hypothetical protein